MEGPSGLEVTDFISVVCGQRRGACELRRGVVGMTVNTESKGKLAAQKQPIGWLEGGVGTLSAPIGAVDLAYMSSVGADQRGGPGWLMQGWRRNARSS